ncbi:hypothetical protein ACFX13_002942 [Malus domestica]|uniref:Uncharacterized protein n=1 Tax=Malus domestica TaxID=3750 RepID=A0A498J320_MALDO|nr:hypothetical protein DVH24_042463 [Malus domestica]
MDATQDVPVSLRTLREYAIHKQMADHPLLEDMRRQEELKLADEKASALMNMEVVDVSDEADMLNLCLFKLADHPKTWPGSARITAALDAHQLQKILAIAVRCDIPVLQPPQGCVWDSHILARDL